MVVGDAALIPRARTCTSPSKTIQHDGAHLCCPFSVGLANLYVNCTSMDLDVLAKSLIKFHEHATFCRTHLTKGTVYHTTLIKVLSTYLCASCVLCHDQPHASPLLPWRGWKHMPQRVLLFIACASWTPPPPSLLELHAENHYPNCLCSMSVGVHDTIANNTSYLSYKNTAEPGLIYEAAAHLLQHSSVHIHRLAWELICTTLSRGLGPHHQQHAIMMMPGHATPDAVACLLKQLSATGDCSMYVHLVASLSDGMCNCWCMLCVLRILPPQHMHTQMSFGSVHSIKQS